MLRYILYLVVVVLVMDHVYTHYGASVINWVVSKFNNEKTTVIKEAPYRESIIDKIIKTAVEQMHTLRR